MVRSNMLCLLRRLCCAVSEVTETRHSIVCPFAGSVAEDCPSVGNGGDPYSFSVTLLSDRVGQDWRVLKVCSVMMFASVNQPSELLPGHSNESGDWYSGMGNAVTLRRKVLHLLCQELYLCWENSRDVEC